MNSSISQKQNGLKTSAVEPLFSLAILFREMPKMKFANKIHPFIEFCQYIPKQWFLCPKLLYIGLFFRIQWKLDNENCKVTNLRSTRHLNWDSQAFWTLSFNLFQLIQRIIIIWRPQWISLTCHSFLVKVYLIYIGHLIGINFKCPLMPKTGNIEKEEKYELVLQCICLFAKEIKNAC